jgi:hypothetical protein
LHLGILKYSGFNDILNADCPSNLKSIPEASFEGLINAPPKYNGGLLCFDKYVYNELVKVKLDKAKLKSIQVTFILTDKGLIKDVNIDKSLDDEILSEIKRIFLNCPQWIPARQFDKYYPVRCKYKIKF